MAPHRLTNIIRQERAIFDQEHAHLSKAELQQLWDQEWSRLGSQVVAPSPPTQHAPVVPQKRSAPPSMSTGFQSPLKRPQPSSAFPQHAPGHALERHLSAPAGQTARRVQASRPAQHQAFQAKGLPVTGAISIPQRPSQPRAHRNSVPDLTHSHWPRTQLQLKHIPEVHDLSLEDFLSHSAEEFRQTPVVSLTPSPAIDRSEFQSQDYSQLTTPLHQTFVSDGSYSPTATSVSSLTSASTAMSEPMSRSNTSNQLCGQFDMFRMDSTMSNVSQCDLPEPSYADMYQHGDHSSLSFVPSLTSNVLPNLSDFPTSPLSFHDSQTFSYGFPMKSSPSQESESSSVSVSSQSRMSIGVHQESTRGKARPLAPKAEHNDSSPSDEDIPQPTLVAVTGEDGVETLKAEIPRQARQPPQRKTTHCSFCDEQPAGFHGDHELRRHIERHHTQIRKVWICKAPSSNPHFLDGCKACRNQKSYGANYNAAAHLRRAHFNPCKNKRGGRNKKSENRGGMGGGNEPAMEVLKHWMFERFEINVSGSDIWQACSPESDATRVSIPDCQIMSQDLPDYSDDADAEYDTPHSFGHNDNLISFNGPDQFSPNVHTINTFNNFDPAFYPHQRQYGLH